MWMWKLQVKPIILQALLNFNLFCVQAGDYPPAETADEAAACAAGRQLRLQALFSAVFQLARVLAG